MTNPCFLARASKLSSFTAVLILNLNSAAAQTDTTRPKQLGARITLLESQVDALTETVKAIHGTQTPDNLSTQLIEIQADLDDILKQINEIAKANARAASDASARDARMDDIAGHAARIQRNLEALEKRILAIEASPRAGYDNGFYIRSKGEKFKLTINGFVRPYYRLGFQKDYVTDEYGRVLKDENNKSIGGDVAVQESSFGTANARLVIGLKLMDVIRGEFEIDYGTQTGMVQFPVNAEVQGARYNRVEIDAHSLRFLDVYGEYAPFAELRIKAGQFKVPFDLETGFDANQLTFTSRSLMTRPYTRWGDGPGIQDNPDSLTYSWDIETQRASSFGRDLGVEISGALPNNRLKYALGAFNGSGDNVANDNRDFLVALRVASDLLGPMTAAMSDLAVSPSPLLGIGAGFAYDLPAHKDRTNPLITYNSSDVNLTGDLHFKWNGISVLAVVFYRHSDHGAVLVDANGDPRPISSLGITAQIAYYFAPLKLEPAYRWSIYDADVRLKDDQVNEHTVLLSFYPDTDYLKLQLQYRGLFPSAPEKSYFLPRFPADSPRCRFDNYHELSIMAQVAF